MITITTDASFCPETKAAGYAGHIIRAGGVGIWVDGVFPATVVGPSISEINAMAVVLREAIAKGLVADGEEVHLDTDCQEAIAAVAYMLPDAPVIVRGLGAPFNRARRLTKSIRSASGLGQIKDLAQRHALQIHLGFVTSRNNARSEISGLCDKRARNAMRRERTRRLELLKTP